MWELMLKWDKDLFPAHAGVILIAVYFNGVGITVPRTRGGDPLPARFAAGKRSCSPHTRG